MITRTIVVTMILMSIQPADGVDDDVFWTSKDLHAGSVKGHNYCSIYSNYSYQDDTNMTRAKNAPDRCLLWLLLRFPVQVVASC